MDVMTQNPNHLARNFYIVVLCAALFQLFGNYYAKEWLVFGSFMGMWPILRIALPMILIGMLAIPFKSLSLGLPRFDRLSGIVMAAAVIGLLGMAFYLANFADQYLDYYRKGVTIEVLREKERFKSFLIFTLSTLIAWEFFHRGFLLGALRHCLTQVMAINAKLSTHISILFVAVFESLFHIKKPMLESMPLLFASIGLSWLTIRTKSLWPALLIHLSIEVIFGYSAYMGW